MMRLAVVTLLTAFVGIACDSTDPGPFRVAATVTPASFQLGDTTTVRVTIVNASSTDQTFGHGACDYHFAVLQGRTSRLDVFSSPCIAVLLQRTLGPGDSVVFERRWWGETWKQGTDSIVPPGSYTIVGRDPVTRAPSGTRVPIKILE